MTKELRGVLVRRAQLRPEHLPVPIYTWTGSGQEALPIQPTWLGIVLWQDEKGDEYELCFYTDSGEWLEGLQYETLEIALDQAADMVGVLPDEWQLVDVAIPEESISGPSNGPAWADASSES